ncbi:hypothetical protein [Streptomyces sp. NPDC048269]|uniref:hypothetical protein n=1 Tax=Streptomyces sp. NPDC048269 TaxID=3155753 RepID=UPI00343A1AA2
MIQGFRPPRRLAWVVLTAAALAAAGPAYAVPVRAVPVRAVPVGAVPVGAVPALGIRVPAVSALGIRVRAVPPYGRSHVTAPVLDDVPEDVREGLAGSAAGSGRERPGRPAAEPANPEMLVASRPLPVRPARPVPAVPAAPAVPAVPAVPPVAPVPPELRDPPRVVPTPPEVVVRALGTEPNERAADLAAHILPLGTGFALMGLGLGYLGVRLRRGS